MDYADSYQSIQHPDENGWPAGDALERAMCKVKNATEAFDLLIDVAGAERAESAIMDTLYDILNGNKFYEARLVDNWHRKGVM